MSLFENVKISPEGVPEIDPVDLKEKSSAVRIIDVRRPDEFNAELGHIPGAELFPLGPDLISALKTWPNDQAYVFVCRSGARSATATAFASNYGLSKVYNMQGGMIQWNSHGFEVARETQKC